MAKFEYKAMNSKGKEITGVIDADTQSVAIQKLRGKGLFPTSVVPAREKEMTSFDSLQGGQQKSLIEKISNISIGTGIPNKILVVFSRQLAVLIDAGLPLLRSLKVLEDQEKNKALKKVTKELALTVEGGSTFSEALASHPKVFDKLFINMVKAGEIGGVLDVVLKRLAEFAEKAQKLQARVKSAMIYPVVVLTFALCILSFLMIVIVPKFSVIFLEMEIELPGMTVFLIHASDFFRAQWYIVFFGAFLMFFFVYFAGKNDKGRYVIDTIKLILPVFGPLLRKVSVSRFSRTLGTLISSGVPMLQALNIVKDTVGNEVVSKAIISVHDSVREGETITVPLRESKVFPAMVVSMIDVGEETGNLAEMMEKIADTYDEEVDTTVEALSSLIEPILIVLLAGIVGFIVIAMFLPLIKLMQSIG